MRSFNANFLRPLVLQQVYRLSLLIGMLLFLSGSPAFSQRPLITSFEPAKGHYGTIVTLSGTDFAAAASLKVTFGSVSAQIIESTATRIQVKVPAGAGYTPIAVTNLNSGLTAYTSQPFLLSFGGEDNGAVQLAPSVSYSGTGVFDVCACDLDGDGKTDMLGSNENSSTINAFLNNSSIGNIDFQLRSDLSIGSRSLYVSCGDLDGDGKADLVFTGTATEGTKIIILRNLSTVGNLSFGTPQVLSVANKQLAKTALRDLDEDGKPELVVTDKAENKVLVFRNTSTIGNILFDATFLALPVSVSSTHGLRITDVNMDGLPDITASNYFGTKIYFFLNTSSGGNLSFGTPLEFEGSSLFNHALADLDNDGKPDLIMLNYSGNQAEIQLNTGTNGNISFADPLTVSTGSRPNGLELGDLNGDGKIDLLIGHNQDANPRLLINTSTAGSLSFTSITLSGSGAMPNVQIRDVDGDAKPDIITADKNNSNFYIFLNQSCLFPSIQPRGEVELCEGANTTLYTVQSPLAEGDAPLLTYEWTKDGTPVGSGYSLEVSSPGIYTVTTTSAAGCSATAEPVSVSSFSENLGNPVFDALENTCEGQPLTLSVSPASEGATYTWTNAMGFQESSSTNSITIAAADPALHAGVFTVRISKGACELSLQSEELSILPKPAPTLSADGGVSLCAGETVGLSTEEGYTSYQWKKDEQLISGATTSAYTVSTTGSYTVVVTNAEGCEAASEAISVQVSQEIRAAFDAPQAACLNQPVQFTDRSTLAAGQEVLFWWDFGDGTQSTEKSPTHTYAQLSSEPYTVTLRVQYVNSQCSSTYVRNLPVYNTSAISIAAEGALEFCAGDSVKVVAVGDISAVNWSNGGTGLFTYAKEGGLLEAEILTAAGCTLTKAIELVKLSPPSLEVSADKLLIARGESVQLQAAGGISYQWEPAESLDFPTSAIPIASPIETTTYTVTARGENGCMTTGEITIEVDFSFVVEAPKLLVPATDQSWKVTNIESYPEVSVLITNKFGKKVFTAAPYQNNWTAEQLPEGVYFYVFKNSAGEILKSGSVTLIR